MAGGMGAGGEPENRQLARMADARDLSGLLRLSEMLTWPGVIGVHCGTEGRLWVRMVNQMRNLLVAYWDVVCQIKCNQEVA
ncbi:hypothetical protein ABIE64_000968 [Thalassospira sp. MBR-102]